MFNSNYRHFKSKLKAKMINRILKIKDLYKVLIFIPLIFYFGKRSYIAFDEGFYALQARWILDKGNWIIPLWWDEYILDRTIGLPFFNSKVTRNIWKKYVCRISTHNYRCNIDAIHYLQIP